MVNEKSLTHDDVILKVRTESSFAVDSAMSVSVNSKDVDFDTTKGTESTLN